MSSKVLTLSAFCLLSLATAPTWAQQASEQDKADAMKVLDQFMTAFNQMDVVAWEKTFHFPHYRLASGRMTVLESPGDQDQARLKQTFAAMGWHHSRWESRKVIHASDRKIHFDTTFGRYREDGSLIKAFDSLYILIKQDGRWGIKMRSSFAQ